MPDESKPAGRRFPLAYYVAQATAFLNEAYANVEKVNVALEEVEETEDGRVWLITLGYDVRTKLPRPTSPGQILPDFIFPKDEVKRILKTFKVDAETGKIIAMKVYRPS